MVRATEDPRYVDIRELSALTRLSVSTIHRLKNKGWIPFYQPSGKGGKLLFPPDAIERAARCKGGQPSTSPDVADEPPRRLSGPTPGWMQVMNTEN